MLKKCWGFLGAVCLLAACQSASDVPPENVTTAFDGVWSGHRIKESGGPNCRETEIKGTIVNGRADFVLVYNDTHLTAWMTETDVIEFDEDNVHWIYRFSGTPTENRIEGPFTVNTSVCTGTWYVEKVSS